MAEFTTAQDSTFAQSIQLHPLQDHMLHNAKNPTYSAKTVSQDHHQCIIEQQHSLQDHLCHQSQFTIVSQDHHYHILPRQIQSLQDHQQQTLQYQKASLQDHYHHWCHQMMNYCLTSQPLTALTFYHQQQNLQVYLQPPVHQCNQIHLVQHQVQTEVVAQHLLHIPAHSHQMKIQIHLLSPAKNPKHL